MDAKKIISKSLQKITGVDNITLDIPEREEFGEYTTNFAMQKFVEFPIKNIKTPRDLAEHLSKELQKDKDLMKIVDKINVAGGGFLNFHLKTDVLINKLIQIDKDFGKSSIGKGKTVVIDYSSPNIAKPFGIGHLSSTVIGQSLYNIYKFLGYKVIGDNHLGDWGTQFGKLLYMLDEVKDKQNISSLSINDLEKLYVDFHQRVESDPNMENEAREWFKKLEDGDPIAKKLWEKSVDISLKEFDRVYEMLDVKIDFAYGESFYEGEMREMVGDFESGKLNGLSDGEGGAKIVDLTREGIKTPLMFLKADGATTYAARDLACIRFRVREWNPDIIIYEVGVQQKLHFQQVFAAARLLKLVRSDVELYHTNHGWYLGSDGKKFSTREGKTVKLEDILIEAIDRAKKIGCEDDETAKSVGVGAIKYFNLMRSVQTNVVFDWNKIINMDGNSGPYLQYTYARTQSVLEKAQNTHIADSLQSTEVQKAGDIILAYPESILGHPEGPKGVEGSQQFNEEEKALLRTLFYYPEIIESAAQNYAPNLICNYLFDLAQKFNTFYNAHKILADNPLELELRLRLTSATGTVLKSGLKLLGIESPERM